MVELKIQKIGDSIGVLFPADLLAQLKCGEGDTVRIVEDLPGSFTLSVGDSNLDSILAVADEVMDRYDSALRELAK